MRARVPVGEFDQWISSEMKFRPEVWTEMLSTKELLGFFRNTNEGKLAVEPECTTPSHSQSLANFVANVH